MNGFSGKSSCRDWARCVLALPLAMILFSPLLIFSPVIIADSAAGITGDADNWEQDGWLTTKIATDRLSAGDEFGCYGIPGQSWQANAGVVASACRNYLEERISASRWGDDPLSIYTPTGLNYADHEVISNIGFSVHGDETGLPNTAWHNASDAPLNVEDWYNLGRRGGSLESVIADLEEVQSEAVLGGLLNFYWIGRVDEATVRHDRDLLGWLEDSDGWSTTWGEAWSYWASQRCYQLAYNDSIEGGENGLAFEFIRSSVCISQDERVWAVPLTWIIELNGTQVERVTSGVGNLTAFTGEEIILAPGWWQDENLLYLTVEPNTPVEVITTKAVEDFDITGIAENFNNHSFAITIAGHATEDLFLWSKRFDDSSLRFTWLVIPRDVEARLSWLPIVGVVVFIASVAGTVLLVKKDRQSRSLPLSGEPSPSSVSNVNPSTGSSLGSESEVAKGDISECE